MRAFQRDVRAGPVHGTQQWGDIRLVAAAGRPEQYHLAVLGGHLGRLQRHGSRARRLDHDLCAAVLRDLLHRGDRIFCRRVGSEVHAAPSGDVDSFADPIDGDDAAALCLEELGREVADQALTKDNHVVAQLGR